MPSIWEWKGVGFRKLKQNLWRCRRKGSPWLCAILTKCNSGNFVVKLWISSHLWLATKPEWGTLLRIPRAMPREARVFSVGSCLVQVAPTALIALCLTHGSNRCMDVPETAPPCCHTVLFYWQISQQLFPSTTSRQGHFYTSCPFQSLFPLSLCFIIILKLSHEELMRWLLNFRFWAPLH